MLPWTPRWRWPWPRPPRGDTTSAGNILVPDEMIFAALLAIVVVVLFVLPLFILLVEVVFVAVLVIGAIALRLLFRQPWLVDAVADDGTHMTWKVIGYNNSRRVVEQIGSLLSKGVTSPSVRGALPAR